MIREAIAMLLDGTDLSDEQATAVMNQIMSGDATDAQIGAFLIALRVKGETVEEITGCARVMREKATRIAAPFADVLDTCGTGGDASGTFNISTATAIVAAGAGCRVAKHGNRSVSSSSGSADVLKALGVNIEADTATVERCIAEAGIGFLFAPLLHGAMKYAIGPRREMGVRTIFNILGPLTNPAFASRQVLGVYDARLVEPLARVLGNLGSVRCLVVHGDDGLDELTTTAPSQVAELDGGEVTCWTLEPEDVGLPRASLDDLKVAGPDESAAAIRGVLAGEAGPKRDIVALNAAAAIVAGGKADDLKAGIAVAVAAIDSGAAAATLAKLVTTSNGSR
ncbi:anthranilate phosphoribosyltransferase [bacterium]|nr:anthranilate phosphoribosyltransferase [bacterium]